MSKTRELNSPVARLHTPQCEATRRNSYANDTAETDRQCKFAAKYEVGGKYLCEKHARSEALSILLRQQKAADARRSETARLVRRKRERA